MEPANPGSRSLEDACPGGGSLDTCPATTHPQDSGLHPGRGELRGAGVLTDKRGVDISSKLKWWGVHVHHFPRDRDRFVVNICSEMQYNDGSMRQSPVREAI